MGSVRFQSTVIKHPIDQSYSSSPTMATPEELTARLNESIRLIIKHRSEAVNTLSIMAQYDIPESGILPEQKLKDISRGLDAAIRTMPLYNAAQLEVLEQKTSKL